MLNGDLFAKGLKDTYAMDSHVQADPSMANVKVELENRPLWAEFYKCGTEMIITKPGRRMFPDLKFKISGLDPSQYYIILLDIIPADEYRYKFMGKCWIPAYKSDSPQHKQNLYRHPDSPALGSKWMSEAIGFNRLKLTNGNMSSECHITLNSMHKYLPRLRIFAGSDIAQMSPRKFSTFSFPETTFMAVTAYQNEIVTNLKIKNNPFAKGFREDDRRNPAKRLCFQESGGSGGAGDPHPDATATLCSSSSQNNNNNNSSSKRRPQSSSPEISTTSSLSSSSSDSPSPSSALPRTTAAAATTTAAAAMMTALTALPCASIPMSLSPVGAVSSSSPTYDFSNEIPPVAIVGHAGSGGGGGSGSIKLDSPTYIDLMHRYKTIFANGGVGMGLGMGSLHHPYNPFYGFHHRLLPQQPGGLPPFVGPINPQLGYPM